MPVCFRGEGLMNRVALFSLVLAWALALCPHGVAAQYVGDPSESRAPRFLLAMAERRAPVPVDLKRSWVLRQPLSLALDGVTLKEALAEISRQARLHLVYADDAVPIAATVNLRADRITVAAALTDVLLDAGVDVVFTRDGRATLVKRPEGPAVQLGWIAGTVAAGETGTPLVRAVVSVVGTRLTAETDASGRYVIGSVPVGTQRLRARMLGYAPVDTSVVVAEGQESVMNFQLKAQAIELQAVVAVGYGEKRRENLTGAVGSVSSEALEARPITNTMAALQGAMPGLIVQRYSGQPGVEGFNLNLRGVSSVPQDKDKLFDANGGNSPLVLIDGIPGSLDLLNPADIQSIDVLKDAAASIYGARAADGALLVTTKRGTRTAPVFTYSVNSAVTKLTGMMETPNNYQMAVMDNEANIHAGAAPMYTPDLLNRVRAGDPNPIPHPLYAGLGWMLFFTNTDWRKAVFENGFEPNHPIYTENGQHFFAQGGWRNAVAYAKDAATDAFATRGVNTNFKLIVEPLDGLKLNVQSGVNYRSNDNTDIGKSDPLYRWDDSSIVYYSIATPDQNWVDRYTSTTLHRNYV